MTYEFRHCSKFLGEHQSVGGIDPESFDRPDRLPFEHMHLCTHFAGQLIGHTTICEFGIHHFHHRLLVGVLVDVLVDVLDSPVGEELWDVWLEEMPVALLEVL